MMSVRKLTIQILQHFRNSPAAWLMSGFLLLMLSVNSCTDDPPPTLYYQDREKIDSLFLDTVGILRPVLDSLCEAKQDSMLTFYIDSLLQVRTSEINKYLERIQEDNPDDIY